MGFALAKLTIFIQCYNRPAYAKLAIESVLRQTNREFRLVISDNSTNDEMQRLASSEFPAIEYRRRVPHLSALAHFNKSVSDADTEFICLFHDDDMMNPGYVDAMMESMERYPKAVAYACNAEIIDEHGSPRGVSFESGNAHIIIGNPRALAGRYFSRFPNGIAPFPAYIHRSSVVKQIPIDPGTGGKYSDVAWLLEISKRGSIVWNPQKQILYRMHAENDGVFESARDRLRLLGYLKSNRSLVGPSIIDDYRFFLYKKFCKNQIAGRKVAVRTLNIFKRYMSIYRFRRFFRAETYAYLYYKLTRISG